MHCEDVSSIVAREKCDKWIKPKPTPRRVYRILYFYGVCETAIPYIMYNGTSADCNILSISYRELYTTLENFNTHKLTPLEPGQPKRFGDILDKLMGFSSKHQ